MDSEALVCLSWDIWTALCVITNNKWKWFKVGSDNDLSPGRRQAIIWTNAWMLLIVPLGTNVGLRWKLWYHIAMYCNLFCLAMSLYYFVLRVVMTTHCFSFFIMLNWKGHTHTHTKSFCPKRFDTWFKSENKVRKTFAKCTALNGWIALIYSVKTTSIEKESSTVLLG